MSICSKPGIDWVKQRAKESDFEASALTWMQSMTRMLKIQQPPSTQRREEPSEQDANIYAAAFFDQSPDAALGIVHRRWFEAKLASHFKVGKSDREPSWYALRNIIFAYGSRIIISKRGSFREAQQAAWSWFENALSVQSQLMYYPTPVLAVQALAMMSYFAESIGCPSIQWMMTSTAMRLAVTKGLHRQPSVFWKLPHGDENQRSYTFWAIYCLERLIEGRSGRPSSIQDDEISCCQPSLHPMDPSISVRYTVAMIKLSQLCSLTNKQLASVPALRSTPEESIRKVADLATRVDHLRHLLRAEMQLDLPLDLARPPTDFSHHQALSLQFAYYNLLWDVCRPLVYPFFRSVSRLPPNSNLGVQISRAASSVATTSRSAILECKHIQIDASCSLM
jgi:hypothetical protein